MTRKILLKGLCCGLLAVSLQAHALESDRKQPIEIEADQGELDQKNQSTPVRFGQTLDGGKGTVNGEANQVEYSSASNVVKLSGNAKVTRGGDKAEGAVITYNTRTEVYTVSGSKAAGGKPGKRVNIVIQPSSTGGKK